MFQASNNSRKTPVAKATATAAAISLLMTGLASPTIAIATTGNVDVVYLGNTIGVGLPPSINVDRAQVPLPPAASVTGSRAGYSFGGWSLAAGGAALAGSEYAFSSTADRLDLYAVWNTTISYDKNGADSGSLASGKTQDTYRFGQNLTLPTVGTMVKNGFSFGGWMSTTVSTNRLTSYLAEPDATGNLTLYAAWIKTVSFNANGATPGEAPSSQVYVAGGERLKLPALSEMTLRRPGYEFLGWSASPSGRLVSNPASFVPLVANRTLYAIWQIQTSRASSRVFFATDKAGLRATERQLLQQLVASLENKTEIKITLTATRNKGTGKKLSRSRNAAVVKYLELLGLEAETIWVNRLGKGVKATSKKNNRVTLQLSWTNPS